MVNITKTLFFIIIFKFLSFNYSLAEDVNVEFKSWL